MLQYISSELYAWAAKLILAKRETDFDIFFSLKNPSEWQIEFFSIFSLILEDQRIASNFQEKSLKDNFDFFLRKYPQEIPKDQPAQYFFNVNH